MQVMELAIGRVNMKRRWFLTMVYGLIVSTVLGVFSGCNPSNRSTVDGIVISEETPYSESLQQHAEETIYSLLEYYYQQTTVSKLPDGLVSMLHAQSKSIVSLLGNHPIAESLYTAFLEKLSTDGKSAIDEWVLRSKGTQSTLSKTKALYLDLSSMLGADYVGEILYELCLYVYDYKYEKYLSDYAEYGYSYLYRNAQETLEEKKVFLNDIGKENFMAVVQSGVAFSDVVLGDGFTAQQVSAFTDEEILIFLRSLRLPSSTLTDAGWGLILSKILPQGEASLSDSYLIKIGKALNKGKGEDAAALASVMDEMVSLIQFALQSMDAADAALLRNGEMVSLVSSLFEKFGDKEWQSLEQVASCQLNKTAYDEIAEEAYGEDYISYKQTLQTYTIEQLKASVSTTEFYEVFKGYVASISPALSYGMGR